MFKNRNESRALRLAHERATRIGSIAPDLDLGHGLSLKAYRALIAENKASLKEYNRALIHADGLRRRLEEKDVALRDFSDRFLGGIASRFGRNSVPYRTAGGKPKPKRRRRHSKPKSGPASA